VQSLSVPEAFSGTAQARAYAKGGFCG